MTSAIPKKRKPKSLAAVTAGHILTLFGRSPKLTAEDLRRAEFKSSTGRMGLRFTDKIRTIFRGRWLKKR